MACTSLLGARPMEPLFAPGMQQILQGSLLFERERERESVSAGVARGICGRRRKVQSTQDEAGVEMFKNSGLRSTRGKAVIVAAVVAMLSTVMAVPASADGSQGRDADVEVDVIAANVAGLTELLDATDATVADGVDVHGDGDTAVVFDSGDSRVEIPDDPTVGVTLTSSIGGTITAGVPGSPDTALVASDGSVVYNNAYRDTSIVVQPQLDGGARMITVLDSPKAPTSFDYPVTLDTGQAMSLTPDGGAVVTGQAGATILAVPAPWAYDASGAPVAADYTLTGTTLTLNVHPTDTTVYPIITDPWFRKIRAVFGLAIPVISAIGCASVLWCGLAVFAGVIAASNFYSAWRV